MTTKWLFQSSARAVAAAQSGSSCAIFNGDAFDLIRKVPTESVDLVVTSPPYCMGKEYESSSSIDDFIDAHRKLLPDVARVVAPGGSICWQVGYHVRDGISFPLDFAVFEIMKSIPDVVLRNRIVWAFSHGLHARNRFSGRHEVVLWFSKGKVGHFDLDAVRVPQKYPGKRSYKGPNKGEYSGNPLGKNPGDVWDIPNVKGNHVEKTTHPCQFPVALVQRLVKGLTREGDLVFDPFVGSGSSAVAAALEGRRFLGSEIKADYLKIAERRINEVREGRPNVRPIDMPIYVPRAGSAVATLPDHFHASHERISNDGNKKEGGC